VGPRNEGFQRQMRSASQLAVHETYEDLFGRNPTQLNDLRKRYFLPYCESSASWAWMVMEWEFPPLLLLLWREQHPEGHEQTYIDFNGPWSA
jgi:hypothetical protein